MEITVVLRIASQPTTCPPPPPHTHTHTHTHTLTHTHTHTPCSHSFSDILMIWAGHLAFYLPYAAGDCRPQKTNLVHSRLSAPSSGFNLVCWECSKASVSFTWAHHLARHDEQDSLAGKFSSIPLEIGSARSCASSHPLPGASWAFLASCNTMPDSKRPQFSLQLAVRSCVLSYLEDIALGRHF